MRKIILGFISGLTISCVSAPEPKATVRTNFACCSSNNKDLKEFKGCSLENKCNKRIMMQGHVECGPVSEECNGRCCHYWNVEE